MCNGLQLHELSKILIIKRLHIKFLITYLKLFLSYIQKNTIFDNSRKKVIKLTKHS